MERVAFILPGGAQLSCMLNPNSVLMRRRSGLAARTSGGESITGFNQAESSMLHTGGGTTELILELLFDLAVAGTPAQTTDVRQWTAPLWRLTQATRNPTGENRLPVIRLIWGKAWNIPGVIAEIAERLELFDQSGAPRRSLMTMRLVRTNDDDDTMPDAPSMSSIELAAVERFSKFTRGVEDNGANATTAPEATVGLRADLAARLYYGTESLWRLIAGPNGVADPLSDRTARPMRILPRSVLQDGSR